MLQSDATPRFLDWVAGQLIFNLVSDAEGMAYQFSQNGVQTRPYDPVLELYQKYLIDLPEE